MSSLAAVRFEPVYLEIGEVKPTEYGKRWCDRFLTFADRHARTIADIGRLAVAELRDWSWVQAKLDAEGVPQGVSSGISQTQMIALINASTKNAVYSAPAVFVVALATAAPASSWTGTINGVEAAYTGYARTAATMGAATNAATSVATNTATVTFPNCTALTSTLAGFVCCDNATAGAGNALWYGTLPNVSISTTQTPPTIAAGAMTLSMTGT